MTAQNQISNLQKLEQQEVTPSAASVPIPSKNPSIIQQERNQRTVSEQRANPPLPHLSFQDFVNQLNHLQQLTMNLQAQLQ